MGFPQSFTNLRAASQAKNSTLIEDGKAFTICAPGCFQLSLRLPLPLIFQSASSDLRSFSQILWLVFSGPRPVMLAHFL